MRRRQRTKPSLFESHLLSPVEDIAFSLRAFGAQPWLDYWLNPRRLRGSDFLMRWSQGVWSERRLIQAVEATGRYLAIPYGPSGAAPDQDPREFELYFERLEKAGLKELKRPDLLVFRAASRDRVEANLTQIGGAAELPFTDEAAQPIQELLDQAILAIECENSLWKAGMMPKYGSDLKPMKRLGGKLGLAKSAVVPTVILKVEDLAPLIAWQETHRIPIHIWHVFYDLAFGVALSEAARLIQEGTIEPTDQVFQAPGGATTTKALYKIYYQLAYCLGRSDEEPELKADSIVDKNGHILPFVRFEGGLLRLFPEVLELLSSSSSRN